MFIFSLVSFGFAVKQQARLDDDGILLEKDTYAYGSAGWIWINGGEAKEAEYSYGVGDTVGIGVNSATRQIIFTKNGLRLDFSDFFVAPTYENVYFYPFVFLWNSDDKIEANFGPDNFKFYLATL
ncbi:hypothetical protein niasHT_028239 [Heterodera trifolii]|uniref:B30.2/SPRY domain-containing protein n=1 Tax=Heterodera trifolii TaxID=157864 RepID=A0ABD2JUF5_9BILA